jgi:hypothetical protein
MRIKFSIIFILVFTVGVVMFSSASIRTAPLTAKPFVITYLVSKVKGDKNELTGVTVRAVKATGEWKETRKTFDGNTVLWLATADAQYAMRPGASAREFVSHYSLERDKAFRSSSFLESHPQFVRRDEILGLSAYVFRTGDKDTYMEEYYAPEYGASLLKRVMYQNGEQDIIEAIKVEFREVSDEEASLPDLPLQFNKAQERLKILRTSGLVPQADALSRDIEQAKGKADR